MEKEFQVHVFGKAGCDKCALLNKRLDQLLREEPWQIFEKVYHDVETVDGLVAFSQTECMNPAAIPGFIISRKEITAERVQYLPRLLAFGADPVSEKTLLYNWHGVQTDYSAAGRGVIPPSLIREMLEQAVRLHNE